MKNNLGRQVLVACTAVLACQLSCAQDPADLDMRAAYCLAHLKASRQSFLDLKAEGVSKGDKSRIAIAEARLPQLDEEIGRLDAFLQPKMKGKDPAPFQSAMKRGEADMGRLQQGLKQCMGTCTEGRPKTQETFGDCKQKCEHFDDELQGRNRQCHALDWLPAAAGKPARAGDDTAGMPRLLQRLALCQDSWYEWKDDEARAKPYVQYFETQFRPSKEPAAYEPKAPLKVLGWNVTHVYPQSIGMAVGFSVVVQADFATTRAAVEKQLGKRMKCETSDGSTACELQVAEKKVASILTPDDGKAKSSLVGCYYFYEK